MYKKHIKRKFDLLVSVIVCICVLPILLAAILGIEIFMPGPVFFKQERAGYEGNPFNILKLRTMKVDKQAECNHDFSKDAERLTYFGKILRRTKIDELPQIFNVLKGDMSLVGPRPTVLEQVEKYTEFQKERLKVLPGMTGLAQVNGNIALSWEERIKYDVEYVHTVSLLVDIRILIKTIGIVICGENRFRKEFKR